MLSMDQLIQLLRVLLQDKLFLNLLLKMTIIRQPLHFKLQVANHSI